MRARVSRGTSPDKGAKAMPPIRPKKRARIPELMPGRGHSLGSLRMLPDGPSWIQPKLTVGGANDAYEQEADRVADAVMRMPAAGPPAAISSFRGIQRECAKCEEEKARRMPEMEDDDDMLQAKGDSGRAFSLTNDLTSRVRALRGGGRPLSSEMRAFMEPRFRRDFSSVRIHTDSRAAGTARDINAKAYTLDSDIVFGSGQFAPESDAGRRLLAHELTHVVQQGGASAGRGTVQREPADENANPGSSPSADFTVYGYRRLQEIDPGGRERLTFCTDASNARNPDAACEGTDKLSPTTYALQSTEGRCANGKWSRIKFRAGDFVSADHYGQPCPGKKEKPEQVPRIMAKSRSGGVVNLSDNLAYRIRALRGGGRPLSPEMRAFMEPRFRRDFSSVRIHTDSRAAGTARDINAKAYTLDRDIVFGSGQFAPESDAGKRLLAHELTHVVQQGGASAGRGNVQREPADPNANPGSSPSADFTVYGYRLLEEVDPGGRDRLTFCTDASNARNPDAACAGTDKLSPTTYAYQQNYRNCRDSKYNLIKLRAADFVSADHYGQPCPGKDKKPKHVPFR